MAIKIKIEERKLNLEITSIIAAVLGTIIIGFGLWIINKITNI